MIILKLYLLSVICCLIIDISGFIQSLKSFIVSIGRFYSLPFLYSIEAHSIRLKPFDCSLCMSFWTGIVFLYIQSALSIETVAACLFIACGARYTTGLIQTVYALIDKVLYKLNK